MNINVTAIKPWMLFVFALMVVLPIPGVYGKFYMIIWTLCFSYWTIETGKRMYAKLERQDILNYKRFKFQIGYIIICSTIFFLITDDGYQITDAKYLDIGWKVWFIIPFQLLVGYCILHTIYFLSLCITTLRKQNEWYVWYMLGFWFYPIGIWIIQPRIIELIKEKTAYNKG